MRMRVRSVCMSVCVTNACVGGVYVSVGAGVYVCVCLYVCV